MEISLQLKSVWWDQPPKIKIRLDDDFLWHGPVECSMHRSFLLDTDDRNESELCIEMFDKTISQTKVRDGIIEKDQLITIENVSINDISLDYLLFSASEYWPRYPEHLITESRNTGVELPQMLSKVTTLGFNGIWKLKFTHPFEIWYLENLP